MNEIASFSILKFTFFSLTRLRNSASFNELLEGSGSAEFDDVVAMIIWDQFFLLKKLSIVRFSRQDQGEWDVNLNGQVAKKIPRHFVNKFYFVNKFL